MRSVKRRYLVAVGAGVVAGVAIALAITVAGSGGAAPGIFRTVSAKKLAAGGLRLSAPHSATPSAASGRAAARAAGKQFEGRKVLEYHYVHAPPKPTYLVVLIYPIGHEFIEAQQG